MSCGRWCGTNSALGVEAEHGRVVQRLPRLEHDEPWGLHSRLVALATPQLNGAIRIREKMGTVDGQQRPAVDTDVPGVLEAFDQPSDVRDVILFAEHLLQNHLVERALPPAVPALVGPAQRERQVGLAGIEHLLERPIQHASSAEPVVVVQESRDPVVPSQSRLEVPGLRDPQVIEPELSRQVRLTMPRVEGLAAGHDAPLGEPGAVPRIILRDDGGTEGGRRRAPVERHRAPTT